MENSIKNVSLKNKKLLLLKKIKLNQFPEINKNLNDYFWKIDKYFHPQFKNYNIVVGNNKFGKNKNIPNIIKRKQERRKTRLYINSSFNSPHKKHLNDSKINLHRNTSRLDKKRGMTNIVNETGLKVGQKYISDFELENLFNTYRTMEKRNKKKINNFMTSKEYLAQNSLILSKKSSNTLNKINQDFLKNLGSKDENKVLHELGEKYTHIAKKNSKALNNTDNEYYKTNSALMQINNKEIKEDNNITNSISKKSNNNFCSISKKNSLNIPLNSDNNDIILNDKKSKTANNFYSLKNLEIKNIISRNNLIKRQNQYLISSKEEDSSKNNINRTIFAKLLANQEQTLKKTIKNKLKINSFYKIISQKAHKSKDRLLMTNIDSFRIKKELKEKFLVLNSKIEPEHYYNWVDDLREKTNIGKAKYFIKPYNIRDPYNRKTNIKSSNKNFEKKKILKYYKRIIDETNKINNNLEGLHISGRNLLNAEYEQFKSLKNKKIINNYEIYLPSSDIEDILFTDKKYDYKKNVNLTEYS